MHSCNVDFGQNWWIYLWGCRWIKVPLQQVKGRTIRQERHSLGLMSVDVAVARVSILAAEGAMTARWDYKFPHSANDGVVIVISPPQVRLAEACQVMMQHFKVKAATVDSLHGSQLLAVTSLSSGAHAAEADVCRFELRHPNDKTATVDSLHASQPSSAMSLSSEARAAVTSKSQDDGMPADCLARPPHCHDPVCHALSLGTPGDSSSIPHPAESGASCNVPWGASLARVEESPSEIRHPRSTAGREKPVQQEDCGIEGSAPKVSTIDLAQAAFFLFFNSWRCVRRDDGRTVAQVLEEEWGVLYHHCRITVNAKNVSAQALLLSLPFGVPIRVSSRLRGGAPLHMRKLRDRLLANGVPEDEVACRRSEVTTAIGDAAILEFFSSFDPWQSLKSKCHGKLRIVKQAEGRSNKPKKGEQEEDQLQLHDPCTEALQQRTLRPDPSFFQTAAKTPPAILQTVSHGCSGLAIVDAKEAQVLAKSDSDLSPNELSIIALGQPDLPGALRPHREVQFPCEDAKGTRLLVKSTLIDLGAIHLQVAGEETTYSMNVVDSCCSACEVHRCDFEEWEELCESPIRHLKRVLLLAADDLIHTWGRRFFKGGKAAQSLENAESLFLMLRIRASATEAVLRTTIAGLEVSPRLESGEPDASYKVIWCPERTVADLRVLAPSTPGVLGVVKSRSGCGVRVKYADYVTVRSKLFPGWVPDKGTPYNTALPHRLELHHAHPGASKSDLQALLNVLQWSAIVVQQSRPRQWLVSASTPPPKDTILTEHGCILVVKPGSLAGKGPTKGRGKGAKGKGPTWLLGSHPAASATDPPPGLHMPQPVPATAVDIHGPIKKAALEMEEKMEAHFQSLKEEAAGNHALLQRDLQNMRAEMGQHVAGG